MGEGAPNLDAILGSHGDLVGLLPAVSLGPRVCRQRPHCPSLSPALWSQLGGCGILGVGIWLAATQGNFATLSASFPSLSAANLLIVTGTFVMAIGFMGCIGAIKENKCLLLTVSTEGGGTASGVPGPPDTWLPTCADSPWGWGQCWGRVTVMALAALWVAGGLGWGLPGQAEAVGVRCGGLSEVVPELREGLP